MQAQLFPPIMAIWATRSSISDGALKEPIALQSAEGHLHVNSYKFYAPFISQGMNNSTY